MPTKYLNTHDRDKLRQQRNGNAQSKCVENSRESKLTISIKNIPELQSVDKTRGKARERR